MKFKNNGEGVQIRIEEKGGYKWKSVKAGEIVDISEEDGLANKFEKVKIEPEIKVETKKESKKLTKKK